MKHIYLDYAATSPVDERVLSEMLPYYGKMFGNADSVHSFGREAAAAVDGARRGIAGLLGVKQSEIYFTSGGTEANNWAIKGILEKISENPAKNRIVTSVIEHASVLAAVEHARSHGASVTYLPVDKCGMILPEELDRVMGSDVALVSVMSANNETGCIQQTKELSVIAHKYGALFHTDAVQAACSLDLKTLAGLSDMMSLSAHKFYGPKGTGILFIRKGVKPGRLIEGGEQERTMRGGTVNVPGIVGAARALEITLQLRDKENERLLDLSDKFLRKTEQAGGITVNGGTPRLPGIINIRADGIYDASLLHLLDLGGVACSAGAACSSGSTEPSHVLLAMGLAEKEARASVRVSFGRYTSEVEITEAAEIFMRAICEARSKAKEK